MERHLSCLPIWVIMNEAVAKYHYKVLVCAYIFSSFELITSRYTIAEIYFELLNSYEMIKRSS